jgi:hypothetical protein
MDTREIGLLAYRTGVLIRVDSTADRFEIRQPDYLGQSSCMSPIDPDCRAMERNCDRPISRGWRDNCASRSHGQNYVPATWLDY